MTGDQPWPSNNELARENSALYWLYHKDLTTLKTRIWERFPPCCHHCGETNTSQLCIDRILETSQTDRPLYRSHLSTLGAAFYWGDDSRHFQILCSPCNRKKHRHFKKTGEFLVDNLP